MQYPGRTKEIPLKEYRTVKMKLRILLIIILICVLTVLITTCNRAGTWLIKNDDPPHADAMVVLMGSISDRILQAADVYHLRLAGKMILVEESMGSYEALDARGVTIISNTTQAYDAAVTLGVPADSIIILPGDARSTIEEVLIVRNYISETSSMDTLLIVTSSAHTRRAFVIFKNAFRKAHMPVSVFCSPNKYSGFQPKGWWLNKEDAQLVLSEYMKLVHFWVYDKRKLKE